MSEQLEIAKGRLYGADALGVTNVKLFPGSSRDVTPEQIAEQINKSLSRMTIGEYEVVETNDD